MHTQDFELDDGRPVTVEYTYKPGSDTTYSPAFGACGGDAPEVEIIGCWPNNPEFDGFCQNRSDIETHDWPLIVRPFAWLGLQIVKFEISLMIRSVRPSSAEYERMEAWLIENHVYDPYEPEDY